MTPYPLIPWPLALGNPRRKAGSTDPAVERKGCALLRLCERGGRGPRRRAAARSVMLRKGARVGSFHLRPPTSAMPEKSLPISDLAHRPVLEVDRAAAELPRHQQPDLGRGGQAVERACLTWEMHVRVVETPPSSRLHSGRRRNTMEPGWGPGRRSRSRARVDHASPRCPTARPPTSRSRAGDPGRQDGAFPRRGERCTQRPRRAFCYGGPLGAAKVRTISDKAR